MIYLGDSVTQNGTWPAALVSSIIADTGLYVTGYNRGVGGSTVASALAGMDAILASLPRDGADGNPYAVALLGWGKNDVAGLPDEATWEANYIAILDKVHSKAPNAQIYLNRPWRRGYDAACATLHTWIDNVIAARAAFTHAGPDEAVWEKGADNGATMTVDGVHYSVAGNTEAVSQWRAVLGY